MAMSIISMRTFDNSIVKLETHDRVESCAAIAKDYATEGYADKYAVISEYDYKAGGDAKGIYMSLILRPSFFPSQAGLLSSLATVALIKALEEHTDKSLGIGWVSNIYCEGRYIGGITTEGKLDNYASYEYVIINFAIKLSDEDFPPRLTDLVKKIFESDNGSVVTIIAKNILNKFFPLYANMKTSTKFMQTYRQKFILSGHRVRYIDGGRKRSCKVLSIRPEDCALMLETSDKEIIEVRSPKNVIIPKTIKLAKK